tara:strand:- start:204 stop:701 length:498 start_codon:yes stop_codon:yes gene_type:complete
MNSGEAGQPPESEDLASTIKAHGKQIPDASNGDEVAKRLDDIELLIEQYGRAVRLQDSVSHYVDDLREELADLRNFRFWVATLGILISFGLMSAVACLMVLHPAWFLEIDGKYQAGLLLSFSTMAVVVLTVLLKGVFRSRAERNHDELLPEHLRVIIEAALQAKQ